MFLVKFKYAIIVLNKPGDFMKIRSSSPEHPRKIDIPTEGTQQSEKRIDFPKISSQKNSLKSLKGHVFKWLKQANQKIHQIFNKIFSCFKKKPIKADNQDSEIKVKVFVSRTGVKQPPVEKVDNDMDWGVSNVTAQKTGAAAGGIPTQASTLHEIKAEDIEEQNFDESGEKARDLLQGKKNDIELTSLYVGGGSVSDGTIKMPMQFAKDLHRILAFYINDIKIFSRENHTLEALEDCCRQMFAFLGKDVAIAAARILSQTIIFDAYALCHHKYIKEGSSAHLSQLEKGQIHIDVKDGNAFLQYKTIFTMYHVHPITLKPDPDKPIKYIGLESRYIVPLAELKAVGGMSPEQLKVVNMKELVAHAKASFAYTKPFDTEEEALVATGAVQN